MFVDRSRLVMIRSRCMRRLKVADVALQDTSIRMWDVVDHIQEVVDHLLESAVDPNPDNVGDLTLEIVAVLNLGGTIKEPLLSMEPELPISRRLIRRSDVCVCVCVYVLALCVFIFALCVFMF